MQWIDWLIVLAYLVLAMGLGLYLTRRGAKSMVDFFVSGRSLPWWLAGTSMAATTFSIDTPLYIAGVVATRGIAGNWEWWNFAIAHVILIYIFARLWRRSEIVTDAELTELRYGGAMAATLRGVKAFLFAVPINCIGIGYAMLAMVKVVDALELWQSLGLEPGGNLKLLSVIGVSLFVLIYSGFSGLWGVVATDFFQFFLALFGAILVAVVAVNSVGGISPLIEQVQAQTDFDALAFLPLTSGWRWSDAAGISGTTFAAYLLVQWWSFRRSDGGGEFIQRLAAARDEREAERAAWWFNLLHYIVRTWPWVVVALVAIAVFPDLEDPELGYPKLMLAFLPTGLLGLVVASLVAAFMSTVSTSINWGASYLTNDLYLRFLRSEATQAELVLAGRLASILVTILGAIAAFYAENVGTVFRLVIAMGTGPGLMLILRWFWWRINAYTEITGMVVSFLIAVYLELVHVRLGFEPFPSHVNLLIGVSITTTAWLTVTLFTRPADDMTLRQFYMLVRPGGTGWDKFLQKMQDENKPVPETATAGDLPLGILCMVVGCFAVYSSVFAAGYYLYGNLVPAIIATIIAVFSIVFLVRTWGKLEMK